MNRKQRNLKYIRTKNYLRRGGKITDAFRVSESLNETELQNMITSTYASRNKELSSMYRMNIEPINILTSKDVGDFLSNTFTVRVDYKRVVQ